MSLNCCNFEFLEKTRFTSETFAHIVFIVSVSGPNFRGILLQARTSKNGMPMGTWILPAGGNYQLLNCGSLPSSALTHTNNQTKTNQVFYWNPPDVSSATNFTVL